MTGILSRGYLIYAQLTHRQLLAAVLVDSLVRYRLFADSTIDEVSREVVAISHTPSKFRLLLNS